MLEHHVPRRIGEVRPANQRVWFVHGYEIS
jgi:hypothetical protein